MEKVEAEGKEQGKKKKKRNQALSQSRAVCD